MNLFIMVRMKMRDRLKLDLIKVIRYLETGGYNFPDDLMFSDWDDMKEGIMFGIDDIYEATEILMGYLQTIIDNDMFRDDQDEKKFGQFIFDLSTDLDEYCDEPIEEGFNMMESSRDELYEYTEEMIDRLGIDWDAIDNFIENTDYTLDQIIYSENVYNKFESWLRDNNYIENELTELFVKDSDFDNLFEDVCNKLNKIDTDTDNEFDLLNSFKVRKPDKAFTESVMKMLRGQHSPKDVYDLLCEDSFDEDTKFVLVDKKSVVDYDGFYTDYCMYKTPEGTYVFVFGDCELYKPEDGDFDYECDSEEEAIDWFNNYEGAEEDDWLDEDIDDEYYHDFANDSTGENHCMAYYQRVGDKDYLGMGDEAWIKDNDDTLQWVWEKVQHGMHVQIECCDGSFRYFTCDKMSDDSCCANDVEEI